MVVLATDTAMPLPDLGFSPTAISKSPANAPPAATKVSLSLSPESVSHVFYDAFCEMGFDLCACYM